MNKQLKRFLCFFLCFCLCFAWFGEPLEANAAGVGFVGVLIAYLISCGIGFSVSGIADSLTDGITELVEAYETNEYDGELDLWDIIAVGSTIGSMGELLLDRAAVDALNGFISWLQESQGWTAGSTISGSSLSKKISGEYELNGVATHIYTSYYDVSFNDYYFPQITLSSSSSGFKEATSSYDVVLGTVFDVGDILTIPYYPVSIGVTGYSFDSYSSISLLCSDPSNNRVIDFSNTLSSAGLTVDDIQGFVVGMAMYNSSGKYIPYIYLLTNDNRFITNYFGSYNPYLGTGAFSSYSSFVELISHGYSVSVPDECLLTDTVDWDEIYRLGLFNGLSGTIPNSVEEYNQSVIDQLNDGVIPDISTDVIVQEAPPITSDGTLEGNVSAIFQSIAALPQTLANLVLDGIKNIFVPDPEDMNGLFTGLLDDVNEKYSYDFDMGALFGTEKEPEAITGNYSVGPLSWELTFVSWDFLIDGVAALRPYIRGWLILMLVFYNLKQFGLLFNIDGLIGGMSPSEWNAYLTPKVIGESSSKGAKK